MRQKPDGQHLLVYVALVVVFLFQAVTMARIVVDTVALRRIDSNITVNLKEYLSKAASSAAIPSPTYHFQQITEGPDGVLYSISNGNGLLISFNEGRSWIKRNNGLPHKVVYPFGDASLRHLTSVGVDPVHAGRVAVTTPSEVYLSDDHGITWENIPTQSRDSEKKGWPKAYSYFTSVSLSHINRDSVLVGTSFDGFYETSDRGKNWSDPSEKPSS